MNFEDTNLRYSYTSSTQIWNARCPVKMVLSPCRHYQATNTHFLGSCICVQTIICYFGYIWLHDTLSYALIMKHSALGNATKNLFTKLCETQLSASTPSHTTLSVL